MNRWNLAYTILGMYLLIINIIGYILMGIDKHKAKKHEWRIKERTLFFVSIIGGSIGALLGMYNFRHKTKHKQFIFGVPFILICQLLITTIIYYFSLK